MYRAGRRSNAVPALTDRQWSNPMAMVSSSFTGGRPFEQSLSLDDLAAKRLRGA
jgi:hypothetical protein